MGRLYILLVVAATAGSSLLFFRSSIPMAASAEQRTYAAVDEAQAREVALTGLADAEATVLASLARHEVPALPTAWTHAYGGGRYAVDIVRNDSMIVVTSTGSMAGAEHRVRRGYRPRASAVPPFMGRAVHTGMHIQFSGPAELRVPPPLNADIHANGHISVDGVTSLIQGHATASMKVMMKGKGAIGGVFVPNTPLGPVFQEGVPEIPVPAVDIAAYLPQVDVTLPRRASLGGRYTLGTKDAPVVMYAESSLSTSAPVEFDGWGILLVERSFTVDHPITTVGDAEASQVLVLVGQNARVRDGLDLAGNWLVNDIVQLNGDAHFTNGSITAGKHLQVKGTLTMQFELLSKNLAGVLWPDHMVPRSHREW